MHTCVFMYHVMIISSGKEGECNGNTRGKKSFGERGGGGSQRERETMEGEEGERVT